MIIFYVHGESDFEDCVIRGQVGDTLFLFLPKIITVLFKTALSDEKVGETIISVNILQQMS